jgi:hypothetical protein
MGNNSLKYFLAFLLLLLAVSGAHAAVGGAISGQGQGNQGVAATNSPSGSANFLRHDGTNFYYGSATATATNAIDWNVGRGTNITINGLTNIGHVQNLSWVLNSGIVTNSGPFTVSGGQTNTGTVRITGGVTITAGVTNSGHYRTTGWTENSGLVTNTAPTYSTAGATFSTGGLTNTAHLRNTGWAEFSGLTTNTAPTYSTAGVTVSTGGFTNTSHMRLTGWTEHSGLTTNTAPTYSTAGATFSTGGVTNTAHHRLTGWAEHSAGVTNKGTPPTQQESALRLVGALVFPTTTNTALTVNQATNVVQGYTTNADFTVTFAGTALDGARGEYQVWNTAATNITVTWPSSYSISQAAAITAITCRSNSLTRIFWVNTSGTNLVSVESKDAYQLSLSNPTAGQVLKWHDAHSVTNAADADSGGATAWTSIGDASGNGSIGFGATLQTIVTSLDSSGAAALTLDQTDADRANITIGLRIQDVDSGDAQAYYAEFVSDSGGTPASDYIFGQTTFLVGSGIAADFGSVASFEIPNGTSDEALTAAGQVNLNETDEQITYHSGSNGEISGEVATSLILTKSWTFDPDAVCDGAVDRLFLMWIQDEAPEGIIIDEWRISFEADPTTEIDADLKYADAMIGVANAVVVDELNTTAGASSEDTDANINGGSAIPNGKVLYIEFGTAYTETTHQIMFQIWYHLEAD